MYLFSKLPSGRAQKSWDGRSRRALLDDTVLRVFARARSAGESGIGTDVISVDSIFDTDLPSRSTSSLPRMNVRNYSRMSPEIWSRRNFSTALSLALIDNRILRLVSIRSTYGSKQASIVSGKRILRADRRRDCKSGTIMRVSEIRRCMIRD